MSSLTLIIQLWWKFWNVVQHNVKWENPKSSILRKRNLESPRAIYRSQQIVKSSVQTILCKYKSLGGEVTVSKFGGKPKLSPSAERELVQMVGKHNVTTKKHVCYEKEGTPVGMSTVNPVLQRGWCPTPALKINIFKLNLSLMIKKKPLGGESYRQIRPLRISLSTMNRGVFKGIKVRKLYHLLKEKLVFF